MPRENEELTFASVIREHINAEVNELHTALPAKIESYDASTQKVDVKPLIKTGEVDEDGSISYLPIPVITDVPVLFPGGGSFRVTFPLKKGDTVLLVFSEASLDTWLSIGGDVEPLTEGRHELTDAIAIPGLNPFSAPLNSAPTNSMSLGSDTTDATIEITDDEIIAGGSGADFIIKKTEFLAHTHPTAMGTSGTPVITSVGTIIFKAK